MKTSPPGQYSSYIRDRSHNQHHELSRQQKERVGQRFEGSKAILGKDDSYQHIQAVSIGECSDHGRDERVAIHGRESTSFVAHMFNLL